MEMLLVELEVCEKMFLGQHLNFKSLGSTGLLISKHANRRVQEIVEKCANPAGTTSEIRIEANEDLAKRRKFVSFPKI